MKRNASANCALGQGEDAGLTLLIFGPLFDLFAFIDSMKLVICVGFTAIPLPCILAFDSWSGGRRS